ncbi:unnamed protein product [Paramecium sonneborni]|uniref:Uncharacterized protein n=1 Tax=Paramecium sonneborni TaxID=65129 RepID=A0A8S1PKK4_9CILI|nr:unnamed protein product [Paramecium sonneborni]
MLQIQNQLQNTLDQLKENNKKFLELIFPQQNKPKPQKKQKPLIDKFTQTIDVNEVQQANYAQFLFHQTQSNVVDDMIEEFENKLAQKLEKQKQLEHQKQQIQQQQFEIERLKIELQSRLISKYGPNNLQVEKNKKEIKKYQKMIRKQQQQISLLNQLNQQHELIENALSSIQQSKTL